MAVHEKGPARITTRRAVAQVWKIELEILYKGEKVGTHDERLVKLVVNSSQTSRMRFCFLFGQLIFHKLWLSSAQNGPLLPTVPTFSTLI